MYASEISYWAALAAELFFTSVWTIGFFDDMVSCVVWTSVAACVTLYGCATVHGEAVVWVGPFGCV